VLYGEGMTIATKVRFLFLAFITGAMVPIFSEKYICQDFSTAIFALLVGVMGFSLIRLKCPF